MKETERNDVTNDELLDLTTSLYEAVAGLPRHSATFLSSDIPRNGIYLFFEHGETISIDGAAHDRIVRVGTHRRDDQLSRRLRQHYRGNRSASVFRKHVAAALVASGIVDASALGPDWRNPKTKLPAFERAISAHLASHFTFVCFEVEGDAVRLHLEAGLIALLSRCPGAIPSMGWLGKHAARPEIVASGLSNTQHVTGEPILRSDLAALVGAIRHGR